jgi:hypothetical protein
MRLGIEHERHRKTECDYRVKDRQNPSGWVIDGPDCRADFDYAPCNYCIAQIDAINLPLFQLTEERVHLSPRRLRTVAYLRRHVEPVVANELRFARANSG